MFGFNQIASMAQGLSLPGIGNLFSGFGLDSMIGSIQSAVANVLYLTIGVVILVTIAFVLRLVIYAIMRIATGSKVITSLFSWSLVVVTGMFIWPNIGGIATYVGYCMATGNVPQINFTIPYAIVMIANGVVNWADHYGLWLLFGILMLAIAWLFEDDIKGLFSRFRREKVNVDYGQGIVDLPWEYQLLGVDHNSTKEEIIKAYRKKVKVMHPDHGGNAQDFVQLTEAYHRLIDTM